GREDYIEAGKGKFNNKDKKEGKRLAIEKGRSIAKKKGIKELQKKEGESDKAYKRRSKEYENNLADLAYEEAGIAAVNELRADLAERLPEEWERFLQKSTQREENNKFFEAKRWQTLLNNISGFNVKAMNDKRFFKTAKKSKEDTIEAIIAKHGLKTINSKWRKIVRSLPHKVFRGILFLMDIAAPMLPVLGVGVISMVGLTILPASLALLGFSLSTGALMAIVAVLWVLLYLVKIRATDKVKKYDQERSSENMQYKYMFDENGSNAKEAFKSKVSKSGASIVDNAVMMVPILFLLGLASPLLLYVAAVFLVIGFIFAGITFLPKLAKSVLRNIFSQDTKSDKITYTSGIVVGAGAAIIGASIFLLATSVITLAPFLAILAAIAGLIFMTLKGRMAEINIKDTKVPLIAAIGSFLVLSGVITALLSTIAAGAVTFIAAATVGIMFGIGAAMLYSAYQWSKDTSISDGDMSSAEKIKAIAVKILSSSFVLIMLIGKLSTVPALFSFAGLIAAWPWAVGTLLVFALIFRKEIKSAIFRPEYENIAFMKEKARKISNLKRYANDISNYLEAEKALNSLVKLGVSKAAITDSLFGGQNKDLSQKDRIAQILKNIKNISEKESEELENTLKAFEEATQKLKDKPEASMAADQKQKRIDEIKKQIDTEEESFNRLAASKEVNKKAEKISNLNRDVNDISNYLEAEKALDSLEKLGVSKAAITDSLFGEQNKDLSQKERIAQILKNIKNISEKESEELENTLKAFEEAAQSLKGKPEASMTAEQKQKRINKIKKQINTEEKSFKRLGLSKEVSEALSQFKNGNEDALFIKLYEEINKLHSFSIWKVTEARKLRSSVAKENLISEIDAAAKKISDLSSLAPIKKIISDYKGSLSEDKTPSAEQLLKYIDDLINANSIVKEFESKLLKRSKEEKNLKFYGEALKKDEAVVPLNKKESDEYESLGKEIKEILKNKEHTINNEENKKISRWGNLDYRVNQPKRIKNLKKIIEIKKANLKSIENELNEINSRLIISEELNELKIILADMQKVVAEMKGYDEAVKGKQLKEQLSKVLFSEKNYDDVRPGIIESIPNNYTPKKQKKSKSKSKGTTVTVHKNKQDFANAMLNNKGKNEIPVFVGDIITFMLGNMERENFTKTVQSEALTNRGRFYNFFKKIGNSTLKPLQKFDNRYLYKAASSIIPVAMSGLFATQRALAAQTTEQTVSADQKFYSEILNEKVMSGEITDAQARSLLHDIQRNGIEVYARQFVDEGKAGYVELKDDSAVDKQDAVRMNWVEKVFAWFGNISISLPVGLKQLLDNAETKGIKKADFAFENIQGAQKNLQNMEQKLKETEEELAVKEKIAQTQEEKEYVDVIKADINSIKSAIGKTKAFIQIFDRVLEDNGGEAGLSSNVQMAYSDEFTQYLQTKNIIKLFSENMEAKRSAPLLTADASNDQTAYLNFFNNQSLWSWPGAQTQAASGPSIYSPEQLESDDFAKNMESKARERLVDALKEKFNIDADANTIAELEKIIERGGISTGILVMFAGISGRELNAVNRQAAEISEADKAAAAVLGEEADSGIGKMPVEYTDVILTDDEINKARELALELTDGVTPMADGGITLTPAAPAFATDSTDLKSVPTQPGTFLEVQASEQGSRLEKTGALYNQAKESVSEQADKFDKEAVPARRNIWEALAEFANDPLGRNSMIAGRTDVVRNTIAWTDFGKFFDKGAKARNDFNKFLRDYPQFYNLGALGEALILQYGTEGMEAALEKVMKFNEYSYRARNGIYAFQSFRSASEGFSFSGSFSNDIPIANIVAMLSEVMNYVDLVDSKNAKVELDTMMKQFLGNLDERAQKYFSQISSANLADKMETDAGTRNALSRYKNNAKMTFDHTVFAFAFASPYLRNALPASYTFSDGLRADMMTDAEGLSVLKNSGVAEWERWILLKYSNTILLDAWKQFSEGGAQTSSADWIKLMQTAANLPSEFGNFMNRTDAMFTQNIGSQWGVKAKSRFSDYIPFYSPIFAKNGYGRALINQMKKVSGKYTEQEASNLMAALLSSNINEQQKSAVIFEAGKSMPAIMLNASAFKLFKVQSFSDGFEKYLTRRYNYEQNPDVSLWAGQMIVDHKYDVAVDILNQKMEQLKSNKKLRNSRAFHNEMQTLIDIVSPEGSLDNLKFYKRNRAENIISKAKAIIEKQDENMAKNELQSLKEAINKNLPGSLKDHLPNDKVLKAKLEENDFDVSKTFYNLIAETFFIEPAMSPDGNVAGWSWGLRENGENLAWGEKPLDNVEWRNRWTASSPDVQALTYDEIQNKIISKILKEYNKSSFDLSSKADFNVRYDFVFSKGFYGNIDIKLGSAIDAYREAFFRYAIQQELAKDEADYDELGKFIASFDLAKKGALNTNGEIKDLKSGFKQTSPRDQAIADIKKSIDFLPESFKYPQDLLDEMGNKFIEESDKNQSRDKKDKKTRSEIISEIKDYYLKDLMYLGLKEYKDSKKVKFWDYVPLGANLALQTATPATQKWINKLTSNFGRGVFNLSGVREDNTVNENANVSYNLNMRFQWASAQFGPGQTLVNAYANSAWELTNQERDALLAGWEYASASNQTATGEQRSNRYAKDYEKIQKWIDKGFESLVKKEFEAKINPVLGINKFSKKTEKFLVGEVKKDLTLTREDQIDQIWDENIVYVLADELKSLMDKKYKYSGDKDLLDPTKYYTRKEEVKVEYMRIIMAELAIQIQSMPVQSDADKEKNPSPYSKEQIQAMMTAAQKTIENHHIGVYKEIAGNEFKEFQKIALSYGHKIEENSASYKYLASFNYNAATAAVALRDGSKIADADNFQFVNPYTVLSDMRELLALWLTEDYNISGKVQKSMIKYFAEHKSDADKKDWTREQWGEELLSKFQRDVLIEALRDYKDDKTISFGECIVPGVVKLGSYLPMGLGRIVRAAASLGEAASPGIVSKINTEIMKSGYVIGNGELSDLLSGLETSPKEGGVYSEKQIKDILNWVNKKEVAGMRKLIREQVKSKYDVNLSKSMLDQILKEYEYNVYDDKMKHAAELIESNRISIAVFALDKIAQQVRAGELYQQDGIYFRASDAKKVQTNFSKMLEILDEVNDIKANMPGITLSGDSTKEISDIDKSINEADTLKKAIIDARFKELAKKAGSGYDNKFLLEELSKNNYNVALTADKIKNPAKYISKQGQTGNEELGRLNKDSKIIDELEKEHDVRTSIKNKNDFINQIKKDMPAYEITPEIEKQIEKYFYHDRNSLFPTKAMDLSALLICKDIFKSEMKKASPDIQFIDDAFAKLSEFSDSAADLKGKRFGMSLESEYAVYMFFDNSSYNTAEVDRLLAEFKSLKAENKNVEAKERLDELNVYISQFADDLVRKHGRINEAVSKALNEADALNKIEAFLKLVNGLIVSEREIANIKAEITKAQENLDDSSVSPLIERLHGYIGAVKDKITPKAEKITIADVRNLDEVKRKEIVQSVLNHLKFFLPESYKASNVNISVVAEIGRDYLNSQKAEDFSESVWPEQAAKRLLPFILIDALKKEMMNADKADIFAIEKMNVALQAALETPENADSKAIVDLSGVDKFILYGDASVDAKAGQIIGAILDNFKRISANKGVQISDGTSLSKNFSSRLSQAYTRNVFDNWASSSFSLNNEEYLKDVEEISAQTAAVDLQNDILLDMLIMEVSNPEIANVTLVEQLKNALEKIDDFKFYSNSNKEYALREANKILGIQNQYSDAEQKELREQGEKISFTGGELLNGLEGILESYNKKGDKIAASYVKQLIKEINPYISLNGSFNNKFGTIRMSAFANAHGWNLSFTETVDLEAIYEEIKKAIENAKKKDRNAETLSNAEIDSLLEADEAYKAFMEQYLPEGHRLSSEVKKKIYDEFRKTARDNGIMLDAKANEYLEKIKKDKEGASEEDKEAESAQKEEKPEDKPNIAKLISDVFQNNRKEILVDALDRLIPESDSEGAMPSSSKDFEGLEKVFKGLGAIFESLDTNAKKEVNEKVEKKLDILRNHPNGYDSELIDKLSNAFRFGQSTPLRMATRSFEQLDTDGLISLLMQEENEEIRKFFEMMFQDKLNGKTIENDSDSQEVIETLNTLLKDAEGNVSTAETAFNLMKKVKDLYDGIKGLDVENFVNVLVALKVNPGGGGGGDGDEASIALLNNSIVYALLCSTLFTDEGEIEASTALENLKNNNLLVNLRTAINGAVDSENKNLGLKEFYQDIFPYLTGEDTSAAAVNGFASLKFPKDLPIQEDNAIVALMTDVKTLYEKIAAIPEGSEERNNILSALKIDNLEALKTRAGYKALAESLYNSNGRITVDEAWTNMYGTVNEDELKTALEGLGYTNVGFSDNEKGDRVVTMTKDGKEKILNLYPEGSTTPYTAEKLNEL
ncbi:MAG: hypothetical protein LBL00_07080, partial [Endomicrobium sp.]|nr:hypothetical protein [Endomicrobium sp.]